MSKETTAPGAPGWVGWLPWIGLSVAFWPALQNLGEHLAATPWSRYALVFPFLLARCAWRTPKGTPLPGALVWIAIGLVLQVAAAFAGQIRWARPALALAVVGLLMRAGVRSPRVWVLLAFCVPTPAFLMHETSELFQAALIEPILGVWRGLGLEILHHNRELTVPGAGRMALQRGHLALAPLLAGIGWYHQALCERTWGRSLVVCTGLALLAVPVAAIFLAVTAGALAAGFSGLAHVSNGDGPWLVTAITALALSEWRLRAGGQG